MDNFFNGKKILITGATGVVGANLYLALKNSGAIIHLNHLHDIDERLYTAFDGFTSIKFDICDVKAISKLDEYDIIFHCAGYGQPQKFIKNPEKTFLLNTSSLVALANKVKVGGYFLFISTSEIYINNTTTEEDVFININPNNIRNCYILGKLCGENLLEWTSKSRGINFKNIRLCLAFGPYFRRSDTRVLNELIFKAITHKRISLIDDGSAIRQYIYVDDAIKMMLNILINGKQNTYNIGGKEVVSILDLAKIISKKINCEIIVGNSKNKLKNSPSFAGVCIKRYEQEFGEVSLTKIEEGIDKCINWANKII